MNAQLSRSVLLACPPQGRSTVRLVILTIVGLHALFFLALLTHGYRRDQANLLGASLAAGPAAALEAALTPSASATPDLTPAPGAQVGSKFGAELSAVHVSTPAANSEVAAAPTALIEHTIASGDTLARIAKQRRVPVAAVLKANPQVNPAKLRIGQKIQIPAS